MKKTLALFVTAFMFLTIFTACDDEKNKGTTTTANAKVTKTVTTTQAAGTTVAAGDRSSPKVSVGSVATTKAKPKSTTAATAAGNSGTTKATRSTTSSTKPTTPVDDVKDLDPIPASNTATRVTNSFQFGTWNNNVFTNSWSNIKLTVPNDCQALKNSELADECNDDTAANGCDINSAENLHKVFLEDCEIYLSDDSSSVEVYYDLNSETSNYNEVQYSANISNIFSAYSIKNYGSSNVKIGGINYYMTHYALSSEGVTYELDYYLRKIENCMMVMVASYDNTSSKDMANFINNCITTAS